MLYAAYRNNKVVGAQHDITSPHLGRSASEGALGKKFGTKAARPPPSGSPWRGSARSGGGLSTRLALGLLLAPRAQLARAARSASASAAVRFRSFPPLQ